MSKLDREDVLKLARLARLDLTKEEVEEYGRELNAILKYVEQLNNVDTTGLRPTNQVTGLVNIMRDDKIHDYGYTPRELLKSVPETQDDHIKVKRMIE